MQTAVAEMVAAVYILNNGPRGEQLRILETISKLWRSQKPILRQAQDERILNPPASWRAGRTKFRDIY
ncbi:MAG: hypothetical protein BZY73_01325 [SAR202 cluster bacterium Casp-Chloro-G3]|nr:MAG: hypothetical protein BZY73_01325 [SAR202 cluster bacterium Casp-Chloro-G3]